jgi:hypothetical protein
MLDMTKVIMLAAAEVSRLPTQQGSTTTLARLSALHAALQARLHNTD